MPGNWINQQQVTLYMKLRESGKSQSTSAARAGISERSAREIDQQRHQSPKTKPRPWRTRHDPLEQVWDSELVPLLESSPKLQAITLLEHLQTKDPETYSDRLLRTLQRRVKSWKALHGEDKEVMFRQTHLPGRLGLSDFTELKGVVITLAGEELIHRLYHFRLAFSHWSYIQVVLGGESYTALTSGLQSALWCLGGSPHEHRTDSLSAAFKNLSADEKKDITSRYEAFCQHYGMKPTRNNRGVSHENGSVEAAHGHIKRRIVQALALRGSNDFASVAEYQAWLNGVVAAHNARNASAIGEERQALQKLPIQKTADYTEIVTKVTSSSTIDVRRVTYTVPSSLIGERLRIRLYDDRLQCYVGSQQAITLTRIYPCHATMRARKVDYRHVINSLVKKPQAFRYSALRDELLPTVMYKRIWHYIDSTMEAKAACRLIVGLLHIAAKYDCETPLGKQLLTAVEQQQSINLSRIEQQYKPAPVSQPAIEVKQHTLADYAVLNGNRPQGESQANMENKQQPETSDVI